MEIRIISIKMLCILLLSSCDTTEDFLEDTNAKPEVTFTFIENSINVLSDSIKTSAASFREYDVSVTVKDLETNVNRVFVDLVSGSGIIRNDGGIISSDLKATNDGQGIYEFSFEPEGLGFHEIDVIVLDDFFKVRYSHGEVNCF